MEDQKKKHYAVLTKEEAFRLGQPGWSSRGYIPHFSAAGRTQHVTFRLADALPEEVVKKWEEDLRVLPAGEAQRQKYLLVEQYLDAGHGACYLRQPECAEIVQEALLHFAGARYVLHAWCVMPNHVHTLFAPHPGWEWNEIAGSWRSFTAKRCNRVMGRTGRFWQRDPFDRYIRDQEHFDKTLRYIEKKPVSAPSRRTGRGAAHIGVNSRRTKADGVARGAQLVRKWCARVSRAGIGRHALS